MVDQTNPIPISSLRMINFIPYAMAVLGKMHSRILSVPDMSSYLSWVIKNGRYDKYQMMVEAVTAAFDFEKNVLTRKLSVVKFTQ